MSDFLNQALYMTLTVRNVEEAQSVIYHLSRNMWRVDRDTRATLKRYQDYLQKYIRSKQC